MTAESAAALVRAHLTAFSSGDLAGLLATMASDAEFVTGTTRVDPAEFPEFFGWAMRELEPNMRIVRVVADADVDADHVAVEFVEAVTVEGVRRHLNRAAFYRITGDVITAAKVYDERD